MNILLVTDSYPPEIRSAAHLMQELAEGLKDKGHNITVCTSYPKYNLTEKIKDRRFPPYAIENGIGIIRVRTLPHHKINFVVRGIAQITMPNIFYNIILKYIRNNIDAVIVYTPPLPLSIVGEKIKERFGARYLLNVQDIFPQNAIDLGILKNKFLIKLFENMELKAYKNADIVTVHSEGNLDFITNRYPQLSKKTFVLHNWINTKEFESTKKTGEFRKRYGLENKFIVLFAGVIGPSQGLNFVIDVANGVKDLKDLYFLIIGDGMEKERIKKLALDKSLENVIFESFVSKEDYPKLVKDCDVGLVCLSSRNKTPVVPGKILGYMAASKPVLAFLNKESDGHKIIQDSKCGYSCISDNLSKAIALTKKLYYERDKLNYMGRNGFIYVKEHFDRNVILNKIENFLIQDD